MRKMYLLALTLVLGLSLLMAACGNDQDSASGKSDTSKDGGSKGGSGKSPKVTLNVTTTFGGTDPGKQHYDDLVKAFEDKYPNVTIQRDDFTATEATETSFKTKYSGGTVPDLLFYFTDSKAQFIYDSKKMVSMQKIMDENPDWANTFNQSALDQIKNMAPGNDLPAVPVIGYYEGMAVNKKIFKDNGLALPTDWDKFTKAIKTLKKKDIIPITGSLGGEPHYLWENAVLAEGGAKCHAKGLKNGIPDCYVKGLNLIKKLYDMKAFPEDALTLPDDTAARNYYNNKQAAMFLDGSWAFGGIPKDVAANTTVIPMPKPPESNGYEPGNQIISGFSSGWFVSKDAYSGDKKKAAVAFLKFVTSKEAVKGFASAAGSVPAVKGVQPKGANPASQAGLDMASKASVLESATDGFIPADSFAEIWKNISSVVTGKMSTEDVLKKAESLAK